MVLSLVIVWFVIQSSVVSKRGIAGTVSTPHHLWRQQQLGRSLYAIRGGEEDNVGIKQRGQRQDVVGDVDDSEEEEFDYDEDGSDRNERGGKGGLEEGEGGTDETRDPSESVSLGSSLEAAAAAAGDSNDDAGAHNYQSSRGGNRDGDLESSDLSDSSYDEDDDYDTDDDDDVDGNKEGFEGPWRGKTPTLKFQRLPPLNGESPNRQAGLSSLSGLEALLDDSKKVRLSCKKPKFEFFKTIDSLNQTTPQKKGHTSDSETTEQYLQTGESDLGREDSAEELIRSEAIARTSAFLSAWRHRTKVVRNLRVAEAMMTARDGGMQSDKKPHVAFLFRKAAGPNGEVAKDGGTHKERAAAQNTPAFTYRVSSAAASSFYPIPTSTNPFLLDPKKPARASTGASAAALPLPVGLHNDQLDLCAEAISKMTIEQQQRLLDPRNNRYCGGYAMCPDGVDPDVFLAPESTTGSDDSGEGGKEDNNDIVATVVGNEEQPSSRDGFSSRALLLDIRYLAIDTSPNRPSTGSLFFTDASRNLVRRLSPSGYVHTIAGGLDVRRRTSSGWFDCTDGVGRRARFNGPNGVAVGPDGSIYIADTCNHRIRKISLEGFEVTSFAGTGRMGEADGRRSTSSFCYPRGLAYHPDGFLVVADTGGWRIRGVSLKDDTQQASSSSSSLSSSSSSSPPPPSSPQSGVWTITGTECHKRRTSSRTRPFGHYPHRNCRGYRDGRAARAKFLSPQQVCVGRHGDIYVTDTPLPSQNQYPYGHTVRRITLDQSGRGLSVSTLAGSAERWGRQDGRGTNAHLHEPKGIAVDSSGSLYVCDSRNHRIRRITTDDGEVTTLCGSKPGVRDGRLDSARFRKPTGLAFDSTDTLYVADNGNHKLRMLAFNKTRMHARRPSAASQPSSALSADTSRWEWNNIYAVPQREGDTSSLVRKRMGPESLRRAIAHSLRQLGASCSPKAHSLGSTGYNICAMWQLHNLLLERSMNSTDCS